ncbi:uncharacterized protein LOC128955136 [Oppia nitens]|uniref:uncharacterized protein LOC128955136 n=1 Tax=Oppia nitens TaxID=1686743 RepID=UPI0023DC84E0|nr:uncharacterized protein LOC128955136 [Oppia nitens]
MMSSSTALRPMLTTKGHQLLYRWLSAHRSPLNSCRRCLTTTGVSSRQRRRQSSSADKKNTSNVVVDSNVDYLGVLETNSRVSAGLYDSNFSADTLYETYGDLTTGRNSRQSDQKYMLTTFGRVRLDQQNMPKFHGHYDPTNTRAGFNMAEFEDKLKQLKTTDETNSQNLSDKSEDNIIEDQYFDSVLVRDSNNTAEVTEKDTTKSDLSYIDKQYFVDNTNIEPLFKKTIDFKYTQDFNQYLKENKEEIKEEIDFIRQNRRQNFATDDSDDDMDQFNRQNKITAEPFDKSLLTESPLKSELFTQHFDYKSELVSNEEKIAEELENAKIEEQKDIKLDEVVKPSLQYLPKTRTAAQYLSDLQSGKQMPEYSKGFSNDVNKNFRQEMNLGIEKLDSKGYRVLSGQVFDYSKLTKEDIVKLLLRSVLFNDEDIVAINKPYGMSIHECEGKYTPVLTEYLPELYETLGCDMLYTVHRLDKDTTGALLLAKTQTMANLLNKLFAEHKIIKRYYCITRGVPDQLEGIIDIPIEMGKCDGKERMVLRPQALEEYRNTVKSFKYAKRAVTQYKVMAHNNNAALLEVWPQTGVKHQIRVHLGFGLRCPILGDHKYSHLDKIVPQKLTSDMLVALKVRQSKVRHIPMHLHARQYCLSGIGRNGKNIFINAPFPHHFYKNMSRLKLRE